MFLRNKKSTIEVSERARLKKSTLKLPGRKNYMNNGLKRYIKNSIFHFLNDSRNILIKVMLDESKLVADESLLFDENIINSFQDFALDARENFLQVQVNVSPFLDQVVQNSTEVFLVVDYS